MSNSNCFFHPDHQPIPTGLVPGREHFQNEFSTILPADGENEPFCCFRVDGSADRVI